MDKTDVLIVGGGIAGASIGARLAGDLRVMIVEAEDVCGRHATGRSAAFWQASLGGDTPERRLSLASKPMFDSNWPGSDTPLLRPRGAVHLTGPCGETFAEASELGGEYRPARLSRDELDQLIPGLREQWTGAWYESSCADIEVAAFHNACLGAVRRKGGIVKTDAALASAQWDGQAWHIETSAGPIATAVLVNAAGAWGDQVAVLAGVPGIGLTAKRRTVVQLRVGQRGLRDLPFVTDLHESFYFKGEGDNSVWVCPLDETPVDPCDVAPEELDVAIAIDRFERAIDWPVEAVERKWAGLRTFAPDRGMKFGFDPDQPGFFWCVGQGGMGIQTAPAASLLCAALIRGEVLPIELASVSAEDFAPRSIRS
ncbi:FAD-binding oxidoreductase [Sphingomonas sp. NSE70-1]|uniref:FAD-binding oxidoreductase n=1 Tax=Sphingomonas caseinilyticus TaxID=2908205 RepID=A0ABT0RSB1_9SPHN|nr:FAD-binding oxidoreductase [Sphingomonas caseinilyticus]MCL6697885.1 FAD-binding oxidoreductase [Sphingomonas caseinilyticus]